MLARGLASALVAAATLCVTMSDVLADTLDQSRLAEPPSTPEESPIPPAAPSRPQFRHAKGWFLGASLGIGTVAYSSGNSGGQTASFFEARFGGMMSERYALSIEMWSDGHWIEEESAAAVTENSFALAATYWATPRFWLRAGLGAATLKSYLNGEAMQELDGISFLASAGYEMWSRPSYSIDISARFLSSSYQNSEWEKTRRAGFSLNLGANWY